MRWLDSLERRFHWLSIPQFPLFIACANASIYLLSQFQPIFVDRLLLDPAAIRLGGQWWRVITFLFVPPTNMNPIFLVFWLLLLYQYSQALENAWGEFRFFFFYMIGAVATIVAALLILHEPLGNIPLNTTLFLAFATLYPDFELLLFFILPIKVKYLAWFVWVSILISLIAGSYATRVSIGASLLNYVIFFGTDIWDSARLRWDVYKNRRRMRP